MLMSRHVGFLCRYATKRSFSSYPLPLEPKAQIFSYSGRQSRNNDYSFALADQLIDRGLLSLAQKVVQRLIAQCSIPEAISVIDFAFSRGMEPDLVSYGCIIRKLVMSGEAPTAEALYMDYIVKRGIEPDSNLLNTMIICYCKLGKLDEAKSCFYRFTELGFTPWVGACNTIIKGLLANDRVLEAYDCFNVINGASDVMLEYACYNRLVNGLCGRAFIHEGLHVFDSMIEREVKPTVNVCKSLVIGFCKWGHVEEAENLCTEIELYGVFVDDFIYTYLINLYSKGRKMKMAMRVFFKMLKMGRHPDKYTYNTLFHGFVKLGLASKAKRIYDMMEYSGLKPDLVTYQIIMNNCCKNQQVDLALRFFNDMRLNDITPNVHCFTVLFGALFKEQNLKVAYNLFDQMCHSGIVPDHVLFFTLVKHHPKVDELDFALQVIAQISCNIGIPSGSCSAGPKSAPDAMVGIEYLLEEIARTNSGLTEMAFTIYIIALCQGGKLDAALVCLEKMVSSGLLPFLTAFNSLLKSLVKEGLVEDADSLIEFMEDKGMVPNQSTFLVIVNELCRQGDFLSAIDVLRQIETDGIKPNVAIFNSIICCLGKNRMVQEAENLFYGMLDRGIRPDETIFTTMINAYSKNGRATEAQKLFEQMLTYHHRPYPSAYTALIAGLVKKNMINSGCLYLARMLKDGFMPNTVLYTSIIKQFFQKKDFEFALRLADLMVKREVELDVVTYTTLISGVCKSIHVFDRNRRITNKISVRGKEMLFHLLCDRTSALNQKNKPLISSQEELKSYALKLIKQVQNVAPRPDLYLYNGFISGFCKVGKMEEAYDHFNLMKGQGLHPNQVTFTILIGGHMQAGEIDPAITLFNNMRAYDVTPDKKLFNNLIIGFCKAGRLINALSIFPMMHKRGLCPSKSAYEKLLSSLCAYPSTIDAFWICQDMISHNYVPCRYNRELLISISPEAALFLKELLKTAVFRMQQVTEQRLFMVADKHFAPSLKDRMDLKPARNSSALTDVAPMNNSRLGLHSTLLPCLMLFFLWDALSNCSEEKAWDS